MNYINISDKKTLKSRSRHETKDVNKVGTMYQRNLAKS